MEDLILELASLVQGVQGGRWGMTSLTYPEGHHYAGLTVVQVQVDIPGYNPPSGPMGFQVPVAERNFNILLKTSLWKMVEAVRRLLKKPKILIAKAR